MDRNPNLLLIFCNSVKEERDILCICSCYFVHNGQPHIFVDSKDTSKIKRLLRLWNAAEKYFRSKM